MYKKIIPKTIRGKITALTAAITFIITILTVTVCFLIFQSFLKKNQIQSAEFSLQVTSSNISSDMKEILYFNNWCCTNAEILHYLTAFKEQSRLPLVSKDYTGIRSLAMSSYKRLTEEYYNTSRRARNYMTRALISTTNENNYLQMNPNSGNSTSFSAKVIRGAAFFDELYESRDFSWIGLADDPFYKVDPYQIIPIVRPIYNEYSSEVLGWNYISISSRIFTDYLTSYPLSEDSSIFLTIGDKTYRADRNGFSETNSPYANAGIYKSADTLDRLTSVMDVTLEGGERRTLVRRPIDGMNGWYISQILSEQQLNQQHKLYSLLILGICLAIISLGILLTVFLNKTISTPIGRLRTKIDEIADGDFSADTEIEWDHELGRIGRGINNMSENIMSLMDKRVTDEKQKKDLEYQILQSQINPHFLYNTLNSIKWMATIQNATGIADMTTALARLLKNVSKGTSSIVSLKEELDLSKDYFLIQQYRYGGSISIEYNICSEDLYGCAIHRFTLQPIIENALFHGIEPKGTAGKITVTAESMTSKSGKVLKISITDNGIGMTTEMIKKVLSEDPSDKSKTEFFKQVGINNVNQRIRYDFGPEYGITISSEVGVYTTMTILLPCQNLIQGSNPQTKGFNP